MSSSFLTVRDVAIFKVESATPEWKRWPDFSPPPYRPRSFLLRRWISDKDVEAAFMLGFFYHEGLYGERNRRSAVVLWREARQHLEQISNRNKTEQIFYARLLAYLARAELAEIFGKWGFPIGRAFTAFRQCRRAIRLGDASAILFYRHLHALYKLENQKGIISSRYREYSFFKFLRWLAVHPIMMSQFHLSAQLDDRLVLQRNSLCK